MEYDATHSPLLIIWDNGYNRGKTSDAFMNTESSGYPSFED